MKTTRVLKQLTSHAKNQLRFWRTAKKTGLVSYDFGNDIIIVDDGDEEVLMATQFLVSLSETPFGGTTEHTPLNVLFIIESIGLNVQVINWDKYITEDYLAELSECTGFASCEAVE